MPLAQVQELDNAFLGIATLKDVFNKAKELEETSKVLKKSDTRQ
jgi:hypothetical protein